MLKRLLRVFDRVRIAKYKSRKRAMIRLLEGLKTRVDKITLIGYAVEDLGKSVPDKCTASHYLTLTAFYNRECNDNIYAILHLMETYRKKYPHAIFIKKMHELARQCKITQDLISATTLNVLTKGPNNGNSKKI